MESSFGLEDGVGLMGGGRILCTVAVRKYGSFLRDVWVRVPDFAPCDKENTLETLVTANRRPS